jgi:hypothetical protein
MKVLCEFLTSSSVEILARAAMSGNSRAPTRGTPQPSTAVAKTKLIAQLQQI